MVGGWGGGGGDGGAAIVPQMHQHSMKMARNGGWFFNQTNDVRILSHRKYKKKFRDNSEHSVPENARILRAPAFRPARKTGGLRKKNWGFACEARKKR